MNPLVLDTGLAWLHHLAVFALVAVVFAEAVLAGGAPDAARLRTLGRLDSAYGALALAVLAAGFARAAWGAKGWDFYAANPVFWTKLGVFALIGLLSAVPTVRLIAWRRAGQLPTAGQLAATRRWMVAQLLLLPLLPLLAAAMARGLGL